MPNNNCLALWKMALKYFHFCLTSETSEMLQKPEALQEYKKMYQMRSGKY